MEYIDIQYKDGRDDRIESTEGDDLEDRWEEITECTPGVQYAAFFVPRRKGTGHRCCGYLGVPRDEAAAAAEADRQVRAERDAKAIRDMHAARDWTWTAPNADSHL